MKFYLVVLFVLMASCKMSEPNVSESKELLEPSTEFNRDGGEDVAFYYKAENVKDGEALCWHICRKHQNRKPNLECYDTGFFDLSDDERIKKVKESLKALNKPGSVDVYHRKLGRTKSYVAAGPVPGYEKLYDYAVAAIKDPESVLIDGNGRDERSLALREVRRQSTPWSVEILENHCTKIPDRQREYLTPDKVSPVMKAPKRYDHTAGRYVKVINKTDYPVNIRGISSNIKDPDQSYYRYERVNFSFKLDKAGGKNDAVDFGDWTGGQSTREFSLVADRADKRTIFNEWPEEVFDPMPHGDVAYEQLGYLVIEITNNGFISRIDPTARLPE